MAEVRLRDRTLWHRIQLLARQAETLSEARVKTTLHFDRADCVTGEQFQRFEIRRLGAALAEHLSEVQQVHIILQDEIGETIQRQCAGVKLGEEWMPVDRSPNSFCATS